MTNTGEGSAHPGEPKRDTPEAGQGAARQAGQGAAQPGTAESGTNATSKAEAGKPVSFPSYADDQQKNKTWGVPTWRGVNAKSNTDPRERVQRSSIHLSPWNCVCLLRIRYKTFESRTATGFLISPSLVATSAHVLHSPDPACGEAEEIDVTPGYLQPQAQQLSQRATQFRWNRDWGSTFKSFVAANDYGVIKLPRPTLFQSFGYLSWCSPGRLDTNTELILSGYPGRTPEKEFAVEPGENRKDHMQWWHKGRIIGVPGKLSVFHNITTTEGQSGSPLFFVDRSGAQPVIRVAAIHSKASSDRPDANVARLVTRQLIDDYAQWAREFGVEPVVA